MQTCDPRRVRVVAGPAVRQGARGGRRLGLLVAVGAALVLLLAYGLLGGGSRPALDPTPDSARLGRADRSRPARSDPESNRG